MTIPNQKTELSLCPKGVSLDMIAQMNRDYLRASIEQVFNPPAEAAAGV